MSSTLLEEVVLMLALSKRRQKSPSYQRGSWRGVSRAVSCVSVQVRGKLICRHEIHGCYPLTRPSVTEPKTEISCKCAIIYSLTMLLSHLHCIDKCVLTLLHAQSQFLIHQGVGGGNGCLWATCSHECQL